MSAFSDFLTQDAAPWWGSGLIGIGGTLLGIGINSRISNKRDQKQAERDATVRAEQNRLEDRRRWETEVRDLVEQASEAAVAMHSNTLPVPSDPTSGRNDPAIWQENYATLKKTSNKLDSIAPRSVYEAADLLRSTALSLKYERTAERFSVAQTRFSQQRQALQKALRTELRLED